MGPIVCVGLLAVAGTVLLEPWHSCGRHAAWTTTFLIRSQCGAGGERNAAASLKTITVAQVDFRSNDRDGNKVNDFWRGDIAGLYGLCPPGTDEMVKLIEISVAGADSHPLDAGSTPPRPGKMTGLTYYATRAPKAGCYWFRAIRHADEKDGVDANSRFAACAFPDSRSAGRLTYVVDERNVIWKRDLGEKRGIEVFPTDEELRTLWSKLD